MAQIAENDLRNLAFPYISPPNVSISSNLVWSTVACREARRVNVEAQSGNFTEGKVYCLFLLRWNVCALAQFDSLSQALATVRVYIFTLLLWLSHFAQSHSFKTLSVLGMSIKFIALRFQLRALRYAISCQDYIPRKPKITLVEIPCRWAFSRKMVCPSKQQESRNSIPDYLHCEQTVNFPWHQMIESQILQPKWMSETFCVDDFRAAVWWGWKGRGQKELQCFCEIIHLSAQLENFSLHVPPSQCFYCFQCKAEGMRLECKKCWNIFPLNLS